jgi:hypothetical protein
MGRAIINANDIHNADKRDAFSIGRIDGTSAVSQFLGMKCVVSAGAGAGETTDNHSFITFHTWGNSIANSREVMRISQRGNVGIGITNPLGTLSILGLPANSAVTNSTGTLVLSHNGGWDANSAGSSIVFTQRWFSSGGAGDQVAVGMMNGVKTNNNGGFGGGLAFWTGPAGLNNMTEKMRIIDNGNVGIGITNPSYKLDVLGSIKGNEIFIKKQSNADIVKIQEFLYNNSGRNHTSYTDFNVPTELGYNFILGNTNGPSVNSATQYYSWSIGLGADYPYSAYGAQFAVPRNVALPYQCVRYRDNNGVWGNWQKMSAGNADGCTGNFTVSGNLTVSGTASFKFPNDSWMVSTEGMQRFYFENLGTTYYRTNNQHIWRSGDNVDLMVLSNSISGTTLKGFLQTYVLQCYEWQLFTQSTYIWVMKYIYYNAVNSDLGFYYGVSTISLKAKVSFNGNGGYTNFTGSHRNISDDKKLYSKDYKGYIVRSTGKYKNLNSKYHRDSIKENIIMDDALPIVDLTSKAYDKSCWGVISSYEDTSNTVRDYDQGHFVSCMDIEGGDYRLKINGCGEGSIWVSDYNNVLENGDYITTSPIAGIGMKQDDDFLHTYTVAKITMDCDFNPQLIPVQVIKQEEYTVWNTSNIQNVYDSSNIDSNTSNITIMTSNIMTSNVLDENGYPVYEYKLDESSNIVYDYEYDMKYIKLDGEIVDKEYYLNNSNVYRLAFCGCSYKCS